MKKAVDLWIDSAYYLGAYAKLDHPIVHNLPLRVGSSSNQLGIRNRPDGGFC